MCNICRGNKRIRLPTFNDLAVKSTADDLGPPDALDPGWEEFDCPKCVPMVPYRRVRAMKMVTTPTADYFGKFQVPIERGLAARFGEYLMREGLIKFTQKGSIDMGPRSDRIAVTAHLGVVSREGVKRAGAVPEIAGVKPPDMERLQMSLRDKRRFRIPEDAVAVKWEPPGEPEPVTDEFDEPKDAMGSRFSGLEL